MQIAFATRFNFVDFIEAPDKKICEVIKVGWMQSMIFLKDGSLAAASGASKLEVWDYNVGDSSKKDMNGLFGFLVNQIALSPDGSIVVGAVDDLTIRIWNSASGEELVRIMGHQAPVSAITFTPNNKYLLTASMDGTIRVWGIH